MRGKVKWMIDQFFSDPSINIVCGEQRCCKKSNEEMVPRVWFDLIASLSIGVVACKEAEVEEALQVGRESKYNHKPAQTSSGLKVYT